MCESIDKDVPLMVPTFFSKNDKDNPKYNPNNKNDENKK